MHPLIDPMVSVTTNLLLLLQRHLYFNFYTNLFYFNYFSTSVQYIYFLNITNGVADSTTPSVYYRELEKNYYKCHYTDGVTNKIRPLIYFKESEKNYYECHCYFYRINKIIDGILSVICYIYQ